MIWPMAKINQPRPTDGELEILRVLWQRGASTVRRSEEHTSELQSQSNLVCRLLLEIKNNNLECMACIPPAYVVSDSPHGIQTMRLPIYRMLSSTRWKPCSRCFTWTILASTLTLHDR